MELRILFVDDERSILKALERVFFDSDYDILTAESGEEGLKVLADYQVDIVVADMRMPGMDGHQFLKKVKTLYPSTTRLILSGYADEKKILSSLIDGSSNLYMLKPWNSEDLKEKIAKAFETRCIFSNPSLLSIVNGLENLSFITGIYHLVSRLIDQDAPIGSIAKVIETDATVTAAVLRIVNSACFNLKTGSVAQAITFLGLPTIKAIVLSCSISKSINIKVAPFNSKLLTRHATTTNLFMTKIYSDLLHKSLPENIATAGLLHNLGFMLSLHYFPDQYKRLIEELVKQPQRSLTSLEKEFISVSHDELGGYLLNWWSIPYPIVECVLFHHNPMHSGIINKEAVASVHIASYYAWKLISPKLAIELEKQVFPMLNITRQDCEKQLSRLS